MLVRNAQEAEVTKLQHWMGISSGLGRVSCGHAYRERKVDNILRALVFDTDCGEDSGQVIRDETVAGPLGEDADTHGDENPLPVSRRLQELNPASIGVVKLLPELRVNLLVLGVHKGGLAVALSVVFDQDFQGLLVALLEEQPTRRLGHEPDENELEKRRGALQSRGDSPGPVVGNAVGSERDAGREDGAGEP